MTSRQFQRQLAHATGESLRTIRSRGFSLLQLDVPVTEVAETLCLSCPGCGRDVSLDSEESGLPEWAECPSCDIAYPYDDDEVFLPEDLVCV
ncbi:MAG: hypothetical protein WCJ09_29645 [Planctomycetota bacterium]